jgi:hypothetical protein
MNVLTLPWLRHCSAVASSDSVCFLFLYCIVANAQTMDSTDMAVLWLRADRCVLADTLWKDVTGHLQHLQQNKYL